MFFEKVWNDGWLGEAARSIVPDGCLWIQEGGVCEALGCDFQ